MTRPAPGPSAPELLLRLRSVRRDPLGYLQSGARTYGDVIWFPVGRLGVYAINAPEGVRHVLQDNPRSYSKDTIQFNTLALVTGRGLLTSDGDFWLRQRRMMQPAFHRQRVAAFGATMVAATDRMLDRWDALPDGHVLDVDDEMLKLTLEIVGRTLFSTDLSTAAGDLVRAVLTALDYIVYRAQTPWALPLGLPTPRNRRVRAALRTLDQAVDRIVQARRAGPAQDDLLQMLLDARGDDGAPMGDRQLRDEVVTLIIAGHETVASALTWTWHLLGQHPMTWDPLEAELAAVLGGRVPGADDLPHMPYARAIFDEALRLYPPAWLITRKALGPDEVGGHAIPAGALVIISPYVVQRQPDWWPEPDDFRPERFLDPATTEARRLAYLPFGAGPRLCIGSSFALQEGPLILATVAQRYHLRSAPGAAVRPEALVTIRPHGGLPMILERRPARPIQ